MQTVEDYSFGSWVRRRRKALDITQQELAQRVGCSASAIFKIENDERRPSRQIAELLANHLEIPTGERAQFLKVARREKTVEALAPIPVSPGAVPNEPVSHPKPGLPGSTNPLIGREFELAELVHLLKDPHCRLLTLTGPGGIGKTRLALEAARLLQDEFTGGAYIVSLVGVSDPAFILPAVAEGLGFLFSGPHDPQVQLINYLREKHLLLVLDNFEHLLQGVDLISEILLRCPQVKLLTTSREPLHLIAEWTFEVQSLPVPRNTPTEDLETSSAAQLFLQRARQVRLGIDLADGDRQAVVKICQLVGGLPLAIELAAAWVRTLSFGEIAQEIERDMEFLAASARDIPVRHRSITAVFDHSWNLLSAAEQQALCKLSVFRGGFTREAAVEVAGATLLLISALVDKSLVQHNATPGGRYTLHEVVQQYAAGKLQADERELAETQERHARTFAALLSLWKDGLRSQKQPEIVVRMAAEMDNLRQAWKWMGTHGQASLIQQSLPALWSFLDIRSSFQEGVTLFGQAVEAIKGLPGEEGLRTVALGQVLAAQGYFSLRLGHQAQANQQLNESRAQLHSADNPTALAVTLLYLGNTAILLGNFDEARQFTKESIELNRAQGRLWELGYATTLLGYIAWWQGQLPEAQSLMREGVRLFRSTGDPRQTAYSLLAQGAVEDLLGDHGRARQLLAESLELSRALEDRWGIGSSLRNLGLMALAGGEAAQAKALFRESVSLFQDTGDRFALSQALVSMGDASFDLGDFEESGRAYRTALQTAMQIQSLPMALDALTGVVRWMTTQEEAKEGAVELLEYVLQHSATSQETRDRAEKLRAEFAAMIAPHQVAAAQARAQARTLEGIAAEILSQPCAVPES